MSHFDYKLSDVKNAHRVVYWKNLNLPMRQEVLYLNQIKEKLKIINGK